MLAVFDQVLAEEAHLAGEQADAVDPAVLLAALQQGLHADADAEERAVLADLAHQLVEAQATDLGHAVADRADAGEHHAVGLADGTAASLVTSTRPAPTCSSALATECRLPMP